MVGRLSGMGVGLTLYAREPRTGYSVDVLLEGAPPVALEVDGPFHFVRAAGQASCFVCFASCHILNGWSALLIGLTV